jgi:hypothetical protein
MLKLPVKHRFSSSHHMSMMFPPHLSITGNLPRTSEPTLLHSGIRLSQFLEDRQGTRSACPSMKFQGRPAALLARQQAAHRNGARLPFRTPVLPHKTKNAVQCVLLDRSHVHRKPHAAFCATILTGSPRACEVDPVTPITYSFPIVQDQS